MGGEAFKKTISITITTNFVPLLKVVLLMCRNVSSL